MSFGGNPSPAGEADLLARAAQWPDHAALESLTAESLRQISCREGVDFATALLFDRFQKAPERATFIRRIDAAPTGSVRPCQN